MTHKLLLSFALSSAVVASCGFRASTSQSDLKEAWDEKNIPMRVSSAYTTMFSALPLRGNVPAKAHPWSDTYWPSRRAGISTRWMHRASTNDFGYELHSEETVRNMTREELMYLSPAEKFDIFRGRFDYPTVNEERKRTSPDAEPWEGICHGWSAAALLYSEPMQVDVEGPSGIVVPFGSADVKALLTYYEGVVRKNAGSRHVGARCDANLTEFPEESDKPQCRDTNAGAFHVVLANEMGRLGKSFILDVTRDFEVWNQPLVSYESAIVGEGSPSVGAAAGTVREISLETKVTWTLEALPRWEPVLGTNYQIEETKLYAYRVELDAEGRIIGGEWNQADRPDFLWVPKASAFVDDWNSLNKIYKAVR